MLHHITTLTVTGADERTDLSELSRLLETHPFLEVGVLLSLSNMDKRYPRTAWIKECATALSGRIALHVCGSQARNAFLAGAFEDVTPHCTRVQINGTISESDVRHATRLAPIIITQNTSPNWPLMDPIIPGHQILIDGSGGRGISPVRWPCIRLGKPVGFAGGMGPDNLASEMMRIALAAEHGAWVDMESKLRDSDDLFDLHRVAACAHIFAELQREGLPSD